MLDTIQCFAGMGRRMAGAGKMGIKGEVEELGIHQGLVDHHMSVICRYSQGEGFDDGKESYWFLWGGFSRCRAGTEGDGSTEPSQRGPGKFNLVDTSLQREDEMSICQANKTKQTNKHRKSCLRLPECPWSWHVLVWQFRAYDFKNRIHIIFFWQQHFNYKSILFPIVWTPDVCRCPAQCLCTI